MGKVFKKVLVAIGLAALIGYVTGILTAPKSGKETREDMKHAAHKGMDEAERQLKNISAELADALDEAKRRSAELSDKARIELDDLVARARLARDKAREMAAAVQKGDAEDDDLRLAVEQAGSSLKHLREYLKK